MMEKVQKNKLLREEFEKFYISNYKPNQKEICIKIGIDFSNFYKWRNGNQEYGIVNLKKVEQFLETQKQEH